jgi:hypothetical protein
MAVKRVEGFTENELVYTLGTGGLSEDVGDGHAAVHRQHGLESRRAHEPFETLFGQIGTNEPGTLNDGGGCVQANPDVQRLLDEPASTIAEEAESDVNSRDFSTGL